MIAISSLSFDRQQFNCYDAKSVDSTSINLSGYGAYLFKRDKCFNCHSLTQSDNENIISLDGLGELYPKQFIYQYLLNPKFLKGEYTKKSKSYLPIGFYTKETVEKNIGKISETEWTNLQNQATALSDTFNQMGIYLAPDAEALALMAFLINITQSEGLKAKRIEDQKMWDSIFSFDAETILFEITKEDSKEKGFAIFRTYCFTCHGSNGEGDVGPNLTDAFWKNGGTNENIAEIIFNGVKGKPMPGWKSILTSSEIGQLVAYIISIQGTNPQNAKSPEGIDH